MGNNMTLPTQSRERLENLKFEHNECGRILKVEQLKKHDGRPFWLVTVKMVRYIENEMETKKVGGTWTFVSWNEIKNAVPDRLIYFDLTGAIWDKYEEMVQAEVDWTTKLKPIAAEPAKHSALMERRIKKSKTGIVSEHATDFMMSQVKGFEVSIDGMKLNPDDKVIVDFIMDSLAKDPIASPLLHPEAFKSTLQEIEAIGRNPQVLQGLPPITFIAQAFREATGLDWRESKITKHLNRVYEADWKGTLKCFYEDGHFRELTIRSRLLSDLVINRLGDIKDPSARATRRTDIPEESQLKHVFIFWFGTILGAIAASNIAQGKFEMFPKAFYTLPPKTRELWRYYTSHKKAGTKFIFHYVDWSAVLKLRAKQPSRRIGQARRHFDRLEKAFGVKFAAVGKGSKTEFVNRPEKTTLPA